MQRSCGHLDFDCGIDSARITGWLDDGLALPRTGGAWDFHCGGAVCSITVDDLGAHCIDAHGRLKVKRSRLQANGDEAAVEAFYRQFVLRFISAGG